MLDLAIAGGGPAGLATAIHAREAGFSALVLERAPGVPDKACGEGLMPHGTAQLAALGVLGLIPADQRAPFHGIRYLQEDGSRVEGRFRGGSGLGIRRTALSSALAERARALGVEVRRCTVRAASLQPGSVLIETDAGNLEARLLVGADGLQSPLRSWAGLARLDDPAPRRFGLRRHFQRAPWCDLVEVHWAAGCECYVTPTGPDRVNVAFLWEDGRGLPAGEKAGFDALLARFPAVAEQLGAAPAESEARGAGPLWRPVRARANDRVALVGDAAGYVDAITGQGLSLAFLGAALLIRALPRPLDPDALPAALGRYHRSLTWAWLRYALPARALLALARRPALRRRAISLASRSPRLFSTLVTAVG